MATQQRFLAARRQFATVPPPVPGETNRPKYEDGESPESNNCQMTFDLEGAAQAIKWTRQPDGTYKQDVLVGLNAFTVTVVKRGGAWPADYLASVDA